MQKILYRPIIIISLVLGMLVMVELLALGSITWRNLGRIDNIKQDIIQGHELEQLVFDVINAPMLTSGFTPDQTPDKADLHQKIAEFIAKRPPDANSTGALLDKVKPLLANIDAGQRQDIAQLLWVSQQILNQQRNNEQKLLSDIYKYSQLELDFAVFIPIIVLLPTFALGVIYFRRQILSPLDALEQLLRRLAKGEKQPIDESRSDPLLQSVFASYNRLIDRLVELEEEHISYTQTLEREIRQSTHALLEQSHTLARSERLAAVGELAASAAHELRNPLAGIQAALENMYVEYQDQEIGQRLQLVGAEVKRLTSRLNDLLAFSKQQPEKAKSVDLGKLVKDLFTLLKYQVNENIRMIYTIPPDLQFKLPETEFRQALLNLMLNSVQELGQEGGIITVRVNKNEDRLEIEVTDSGKGFPKALLQDGVKPFASYRENGTGLGLSMVQRFVRSLGGQLNIRNDAQGHACANLWIPATT